MRLFQGYTSFADISLPKYPMQPPAPPHKNIVHMDMDTFFVSVERLHDASLVGKPVIVGGHSERGVVASCSYETRIHGVHAGMGIKQAKRLCPEAIIVSGRYESYSEMSAQVQAVVAANAPVYEFASIDEFYCDLTGTERYFGSYKLAGDIRQKIIAQTKLPISMGHATTKTTAKIATGTAKPSGQREVPHGTEAAFLAPLGIQKIPGVGEKTVPLLRAIGVRTIGDAQQRSPEQLQAVLGKYGPVLWEKAWGVHVSELAHDWERKSIGAEETFDTDTTDRKALKALLLTLTEKILFRLRAEGKLAGCVTVKFRYTNFETHSRQGRIPYSSQDVAVYDAACALFDDAYDGVAPLRLVGVSVSQLIEETEQLNLFVDAATQRKLHRALDGIKARYGRRAIFRAEGMQAHERGNNKDDRGWSDAADAIDVYG